MPRQTRLRMPAFVARESKTGSCLHSGNAPAKSEGAKMQWSGSARVRSERSSCLSGCKLTRHYNTLHKKQCIVEFISRNYRFPSLSRLNFRACAEVFSLYGIAPGGWRLEAEISPRSAGDTLLCFLHVLCGGISGRATHSRKASTDALVFGCRARADEGRQATKGKPRVLSIPAQTLGLHVGRLMAWFIP
jgi:hypothetical protein